MKIKIDVAGSIAELEQQYQASRAQVQRAANAALNESVRAIERAWRLEMRDVLDRPTQYTLNSIFVIPAANGSLSASVGLKSISGKGTPASDYLAPQIDGGERKQKRFERALQSVGALPAGYRIVPGSGAKIDAYGNLDQGQIVQILSFFQSFAEVGYQANMSARRRQALAQGSASQPGVAYFVGRPGDRLPLGIYQRVRFGAGSAIKPIMMMVRSANYHAVLDLEYVANKTFDRVFPAAFAAAMAAQ